MMKPSARPALRHKKITSHKSTSASISSLKNLNLKDSVSRPMINTFNGCKPKRIADAILSIKVKLLKTNQGINTFKINRRP